MEDIEEERKEPTSQKIMQFPPYPKKIIIKKVHTQEETKIFGELKILFVKIPLLQDIKDVLIYKEYIK